MTAPAAPPYEPPPVSEALPLSARLDPPRPDPFGDETHIPFVLPIEAPVRLAVYAPDGRQVALLVDAALPPGRHIVRFDAEGLAPGVYVCEMEAPGCFASRKMTLRG